MAFIFTKIFRNVILVVVFFNLISYYLRWKQHNIKANEFKTISTQAASDNALSSVSKFQSDFKRTFKGRTLITETNWVPLSMGGLQLRAQFFYATPFETITILAAASSTVGRTGFHWSNSSCTVLTGEVVRHSDAYSGLVKEIFTKGQNFRHGQFESYIYEFKEGAHLTCYSRGFIPVSGISAFIGSLASGDFIGAARILYSYNKIVFENVVVSVTELFHHLMNKAKKFEL